MVVPRDEIPLQNGLPVFSPAAPEEDCRVVHPCVGNEWWVGMGSGQGSAGRRLGIFLAFSLQVGSS